MENNGYVQKILNCFASMDIEGLRTHLKENNSYGQTTKEIFLEVLESEFKSLRLENTELIISRGKCYSKSCQYKGGRGYRFIGNNNKDFLNFIFDIRDDNIEDICNCCKFCSNDDSDDLGEKRRLYINSDDHIDFYKSELYKQKVELALTAYREIIFETPKAIDFEKLESWINEHIFSIELIGGFDMFAPRMKWTPFLQLFEELKEIYDFINIYKAEIDSANLDFEAINEESDFIKWILFHETMVKNAPFVWNYKYQIEGNYYAKTETDPPIHFNGKQMLAFFDFLKNYDKKQGELFDKYNSLSHDEEMEILRSDNDLDHAEIFSLRFHLVRRKGLAEAGIDIPLYLNN